MRDDTYIEELYRRFLDGQSTPEELRELLAHFEAKGADSPLAASVREQLQQQLLHGGPMQRRIQKVVDAADKTIAGHIGKDSLPGTPARRQQNTYRHIAAVAILLLLAVGSYLYYVNSVPKGELTSEYGDDVLPGGNKAVLTLADGRKIMLDDAANGELAEESGIRITKTEDGQLVYEILRHAPQALASEGEEETDRHAGWRASATRDPAAYNTIETPRGGQYKVILPDSSVVWLNASSSLKYPTRFDGEERRVELTGEAFFSVRHKTQDTRHKTASAQADAGKVPTTNIQPFTGARSLSDYWRMSRVPFIVSTATQEVTVLGTAFNINAYDGEPHIATTLVAGKVQVSLNEQTKYITLAPGQQAVAAQGKLAVTQVDTDDYTAWKDDLFIFHHVDLATIIRQAERWYDVTFIYDPAMGSTVMYGDLSRSMPLSALLKALELNTGLKFKIEGRRVMVEE